MSYAILELELGAPPASVHRYGSSWYVVCERCRRRSPLLRYLSLALDLHNTHADKHVEADRQDLEELLSTDALPLAIHRSEVRPQVPPLTVHRPTSVIRDEPRRSVVHLSRPQRKVS